LRHEANATDSSRPGPVATTVSVRSDSAAFPIHPDADVTTFTRGQNPLAVSTCEVRLEPV